MTANHRPLEDGDIELIDRVRAIPCLYDTKDPNFRLVYKKEQEWDSIAESLSIPHWEARKRWTVLRDRYARELKQLVLHPESTKYGKNDFFLRMDFLRSFVKKREGKRKRTYSQGLEMSTEKPRPLKLFKVNSDGNSFDSEDHQLSQRRKSHIVDDSQDSSNLKFSYVDQISRDATEQDQHENIQIEEQEYHNYIEDSSVTYEALEEDHENGPENYMITSSDNMNENITIRSETSKVANILNITNAQEENISTLPHLQQRPIVTDPCIESASPSLPVDTEEYFSKTIASYLRQLSPRYKIKAKVEMMQIIEKYIDLEESK